MVCIINTGVILLKNKSKTALIIGLSVIGLAIYNRELIWLNIGRTTEVVIIISTKNANNYVNEREKSFDIEIQKHDSSTEILKLEKNWWSLASSYGMYPKLTEISKTKECARVQIYGINIPYISQRQIYNFEEIQCPSSFK